MTAPSISGGGATYNSEASYTKLQDDSIADSKAKEQDKINTSFFSLQTLLYVGCCGLMVIFVVLERVVFKFTIDRLSVFRYIVSQLIVLFHIPFSLIIFLYYHMKNKIDKEVYLFPKWKFLIMAILDMLANICYCVGGSKITPVSTILLVQLATPISLLLNSLTLKSHYHILHWIGCAILCTGVILNVIFSPMLDNASHVTADQKEVILVNCGIFLVGVLLSVISSCVKEAFIRDSAMCLSLMDLWIYFFQIVCGLALSPLGFEFQGLSSGITNVNLFSTYGNYMNDGFGCIFSGDPPLNISDIGYIPDDMPPYDFRHCGHSFLYIGAYVLTSLMLNLLLVIVVTRCSLRLMHMSNSLAIPIASFLLLLFPSSTSWVVDPEAPSISVLDIMFICLVSFGTFIYHWHKEPNGFSITPPAFPDHNDEENEFTIKEESSVGP